MPTFTTLDNEMPEIDPDALTVNLTGAGIGPDDLVKKPENVNMPKEHFFPGEVEEFGGSAQEPAVSEADADEIAEEKISEVPITENAQDADHGAFEIESDKDEEEIKAIEKMLKSSRSARQKEKQKSSEPLAAPKKKKIDPIVVVSCVIAVLLIGVFSAYFLGFFSNKESLNISVEDYTAAYRKTSSYKLISSYGFDFPTVTYAQDEAASTFTGSMENSNNYPIDIIGSLDKDGKIQRMVVVFRVTSQNSYEDIKHILAPYVQVLYPNMTDAEARAFIEELYTSKAGAIIKGNYGMSLMREVQDSYINLYLYSLPVNDAKTLIKQTSAAASSAAAAVSAAPTETAVPAA